MKRKTFIKITGLGILNLGLMELNAFGKMINSEGTDFEKMPVLFIGHGSPMNAIEDNEFTWMLKKTGKSLPRPKAILCISAHWLTDNTFVNISRNPKMIYDMYGFPKELYEVDYPSKGSPETAQMIQKLVSDDSILADNEWGYDHGTWAVMQHLFPQADIPLFQMSLDYHKPMQYHYELAQELVSLRQKGVLIVGSGNITHNLSIFDMSDMNAKPLDWALEFDSKVKYALEKGDHEALINYNKWGSAAKLAVPEPSHYLPLIYAIALQENDDDITYPYEGFHYASASMRCVRIG